MQKPAPVYSLQFVLHPEQDDKYVHFENAAANPFRPELQAGVPRVNVWWLADAALLSYWAEGAAKPRFEAAGLTATFVTGHGTDCYVAVHKDFVIVAFRGTQPDQWKDILADANIILVPGDTGFVHFGFKKAFEVVKPQLDALLKTVAPNRSVWFCGHSLGAALATLAGYHYALQPGISVGGICTFGSPRVGDPTFSHAFNAKMANRSVRYVNDHDVVTHVPLPLGYEHVETRRFIAPDGTVSRGQPTFPHFFTELMGRPKTLLTMMQGFSKDSRQPAPLFLLDHMPKAYAVWTWNDYEANG